MSPVRLGIVGMGGYAGAHHEAIVALEARGLARLICTCDPHPQNFSSQQDKWDFPRRGVKVFTDYLAMLEKCRGGLDLLVIPTPIALHEEMHRKAMEFGLAVYLEKPPTLDPLELERMIASNRPERFQTLVGFNFIIEPTRQALKKRLLAGEFGQVRETHLVARWPRPTTYFQRNSWAGRLLTDDGRLVLDSCFGNAVAHFVHNMLYWAGGPGLASWAQIETVRAELYRAHQIEGADTFFVEGKSTMGVTMRFAVSHASAGTSHQAETVICERATLHYVIGKTAEIHWADGHRERIVSPAFDALAENHLEYYRYLRGEVPRPATTLTDSRPFVTLNGLAYVSSEEITTLAPALLSRTRNPQDQTDYLDIQGLEVAQVTFLTQGKWPGTAGWGRKAVPASTGLAELSRLHPLIRALAAKPS